MNKFKSLLKSRITNLLFLITLIPIKTFACSAFYSDGQTKYLAKNFDWANGQGYIIKNNIGQRKYAYGLRGSNQANWISKYGSITFNQIGKEFPYGGMNEKGLVVEQLWMSESVYPDNNTQTISELEWIQYQLDNYSSVDEIIQHINDLTIKPIATVHYFIADENGHSAVVDFVNGQTVISRKSGKTQVITNETFLNSENYFAKNHSVINKSSRTNFDRFCQIKNSLSNIQIENQSQAFEILGNSSEDRPNYKTYWTIVYDLSNRKVYYKSLDNKTIKQFSFSELDFQTGTGLQASNINSDTFNLQDYTYEMNEKQFVMSMKMMGLKIDQELGSAHQMMPDQNRIDKIYQDNYIDLTITFLSKSPKGDIYYTLVSGEENFIKRQGVKSGIIAVKSLENKKTIYAMPKGEYALACYQDTDLDKRIDTKLFGIPKNYGFSRNNRGLFGIPPKYEDAKLSLNADSQITVEIK